MYRFLKKVVTKIFPQEFLFRIEPLLRKAYSLFFIGTRYQCTVCSGSFRQFIRAENDELICPRCGSLPRDRRLYRLLLNEKLVQGKILDFSPSRPLYRKLIKVPGAVYYASDFSAEFLSDYHFDITAIQKNDNYFDLVICYHVLEHIADDRKAMEELFRVIKPGGTMILQTPFREGTILEDPAIQTEGERMKHFGQKDHVRIYSVEGLTGRLTSAGWKVKVLSFTEPRANPSGFSEKEFILICKK